MPTDCTGRPNRWLRMYSRALMSGIQYIMNNNRKKANKSNNGSRKVASVATAIQKRNTGPKVLTQTKMSRRVVHSELVATISGDAGFGVNAYPCNPGMASTFPWLSSQADGYEQYHFHKLVFEFVTRTSTTTTGSVILAPDYDPTDALPASEAQVTSYMDAVENVPWTDISCALNVSSMFPMGPRKFVRTSNVAGDLKVYDVANLFVCPVTTSITSAIGKLWVHYDVELFIPQTINSAPSAEKTSIAINDTIQTLATGVAESVEFFDETIVDTLNLVESNRFIPPKGAYEAFFRVDVNDSSAEALSVVLSLEEDGVAVTEYTSKTSGTVVVDGGLSCTLNAYIIGDGVKSYKVMVTATGAAGTLTIPARGAFSLFRMA